MRTCGTRVGTSVTSFWKLVAAIFRSLESKGDYHSFQFYRRINPNFMEDQKSTFQCSNSKGNAREICFRSRVIKKYAHNEEFFSSDSISPLLHTTRPSTTRSSIFLSKRKSWSRFVRERERGKKRGVAHGRATRSASKAGKLKSPCTARKRSRT